MRNASLIVLLFVTACAFPDEHFIVGDPRLIGPASMSTVTSQRPKLRWAGFGDAPTVDLCKDRLCTMPLAISTQLAPDHVSAVPTAALPPGWVFWRVHGIAGTQAVTSATWQFWVGKLSAGSPVDTSSGAVLDVNGDGFPDFVVGAENVHPQGSAGAVHVYLGSAATSATGWNGASAALRIDLASPDPASGFGFAVANAGDVNGDGFADFLVSTFSYGDGTSQVPTTVHLYLGSARPSTNDWNGLAPALRIDLTNPDGRPTGLGESVAGAGDVNGDGYADFLVNATFIPGTMPISQAAYLYFGSATPSAADWSADLSPNRVRLTRSGQSTQSLASAGDVNGDGYGDFLIAASGALAAAQLYLGSATPRAVDWNLGSNSARIDLNNPEGETTRLDFVASAGDVNGDGYGDFLVGTKLGTSGAAHLYLGSAKPVGPDWSGTAPPRRIDLISSDDTNGLDRVAGVGDLNGDGYGDFVVGSDSPNPGGSRALVYLGSPTPSAADWVGTSPARRIDLVSPAGDFVYFGYSVASAGDVNGDGFADFVVGSPGTATVHFYLGSATPGTATWNGASPAGRIDLINPGAGEGFGGAVARGSRSVDR